jgi:cytochrome c-type biogenesis protein CcsB
VTTTALHQVCLLWFAVLVPVYLFAAWRRALVMVWSANVGLVVGLLLIGATIWRRGTEVGHAPFQTLYEVYLLLALSLVAAYLLIHISGGLEILKRAGTVLLSLFGALTCVATAVVLVMGLRAGDFQTDLPPALQSPWFVPHVVVYLFGYGSLGLAVASASLYLVGHRTGKLSTDALDTVDAFTHRIIAMGFPFLTAGLIFGSLWAYEAWANYWAWDSKEVWSLISWFIYLIYMHLRLIRGWRGKPAAWLVIIGGAAIAVTLLLFGYLPASITSVHKY